MSRSYKKKPYSKQGYGKGYKKKANKRIRRTEDPGDFSVYKKYFCSWLIWDWSWRLDPDHDYDGYFNFIEVNGIKRLRK